MKRKYARLKRLESIRARMRDLELGRYRKAELEANQLQHEYFAGLEAVQNMARSAGRDVDDIAWMYASIEQIRRDEIVAREHVGQLRHSLYARQIALEQSKRVRERARDELAKVVADDEREQIDEWTSANFARAAGFKIGSDGQYEANETSEANQGEANQGESERNHQEDAA